MRFLAFQAFALALHGLLLYYVWRRLVRDTAMPRPWRTIVTVALIVLELQVPVVMWLSRAGATAAASALAWPAFLWLALFGLTFVALVAIDVARLGAHVVRLARRRLGRPRGAYGEATEAPPDPARRELLARIGGGAAVAAAAGSVALGTRAALGDHEVVDVPVTLRRLPPALDGFTIVQLTDLHVGLTVGRAFVEDVVARVNALAPDLIVLTGDLVDGPAEALAPRMAPLGELRAPHGVYSVTGNHEYYSGADAWIEVQRGLGIRVLRNERVQIVKDGASFDLAGIDDHTAADHAAGHGADLPAALAGRDPARAVVLLAHQPRQVRVAARHDVDLQLSGHTHGGQIWPWHHIVNLQQGGLLAGRYRRGDTQLYVSRGVGYWGPPVRLGAPSEITRVILRSGDAAGARG